MKKHLLLTSIIASAFLASAGVQAADETSSLSPSQTKQIEQVIHNYLVKNPQVLIEASQALQQQQMSKMQQTATKAINKNAKDLFNNPESPVIGNPNGDITLIEFMDYQCAHCKDMGPIIDQLIGSDLNLRVVYKEFPIFGPTSEFAAKAALAAQKQGKYAAFHDALMRDDNPLTKDEILKIAQQTGLDTAKLEKDIDDATVAKQLKDNLRLAQDLGLLGTPAIIVGDRQGNKVAFIPGTASKQNLQQLISQLRQKS